MIILSRKLQSGIGTNYLFNLFVISVIFVQLVKWTTKWKMSFARNLFIATVITIYNVFHFVNLLSKELKIC